MTNWFDGKTAQELHQIVSDMSNWINRKSYLRTAPPGFRTPMTFPASLAALGLKADWYPDRGLWTQYHNDAVTQIKILGGN